VKWALPVSEATKLFPQFIGEGVLPCAQLLSDEGVQLDLQGIFCAFVLVAGRLIDKRDQTNFRA